jgi:hypothetical protein
MKCNVLELTMVGMFNRFCETVKSRRACWCARNLPYVSSVQDIGSAIRRVFEQNALSPISVSSMYPIHSMVPCTAVELIQ